MLWTTRRSLFDEFERINRDMGRLFATTSRWVAPNFPAMNIWMNEEQILVSAELPGLSADDLDIALEGDTLTISGTRHAPAPIEGATAIRREREFGEFSRAFHLPYQVNADNVSASFQNGILLVALPRAEADKPRKIEVLTG